MAAMNRLPDDLLTHILHEDWLYYNKRAPWSITFVCRQWRALALATT